MSAGRLLEKLASAPARRVHVALPLAMMAALWVLSSIPGQPSPDDPDTYQLMIWIPPNVQNLLHIPAYFGLAWAWRWSLGAWTRHPTTALALALALAAAYGLVDEWHQSLIPGRYGSWSDVAFNVAGAVLGVVLFRRFASRNPHQTRKG